MQTENYKRINFKSTEVMSTTAKRKGISFVPSKGISEEAKLKLEGVMKRKSENINNLVAAYKRGDLVPQK